MADYVLFRYRRFSGPLPGDPKDAACRVDDVDEFFFKATEKRVLPFALGDGLRDAVPKPSDVVMLQPLYLMAIDSETNRWLLTIRRQDSIVTACKLVQACEQPPYDDLYWSDAEGGSYIAGDEKLHNFFAGELGFAAPESTNAPPSSPAAAGSRR